jgi:hypothetical protein
MRRRSSEFPPQDEADCLQELLKQTALAAEKKEEI